ncbi:MAG: DoxX family membrane protein [Bacteroidota bacterium]|nr:DoxX family membrane protein [Bacteroidota bacterium]
MRILVNISRVLVGVLFIFSGLVKANDPLGLSYKMQEFFEVWAQNPGLTSTMNWLHSYALPFSIIMITLEIIVGAGILLGIWKRFFSLLLFLLIIFFSFLTGYAVLSGKIATCGCFGDCIPLTAMQSFIKDLILLVLILVIFFGAKYIIPVLTPVANFLILLISIFIVLGFQWFVMRHLPVVDCLPFKKGNNLLELRKMPANAIPDKKDFKFIYKKNGKEQEFTRKNIPDSTWEFVSREDFIVEKGSNNEPPVKDFYLSTFSGNDSTEAILGSPRHYYLFFIKDLLTGTDYWLNNFNAVYKKAKQNNIPLYVVASQPSAARQFFNERNKFDLPILSLDATALKTAARTNPELYLMNGPVVENKWGWADFDKAVR